MCYSAQIERDWRKYLRVMGTEATLDLGDFIKKYWWRQNEFPSMKIPKAVDAWFADPQNGDEQKIAAFIEAFNDQEISKLEQETFKQKKRLADAQRALAIKETKKALNDQRASSSKIEWALGKLGDIKRSDFKPRDARIFPGWFVPVSVVALGRSGRSAGFVCSHHGRAAFRSRCGWSRSLHHSDQGRKYRRVA